jgi:AraC-like DNA-binding protein
MLSAVLADPASVLCYSARLLRPFVSVLSESGSLDPSAARSLAAIDPDTRVPIGTVERQLRLAIEITGDVDLGLRAGASMSIGDCSALDYATSTAANVREAVETAMRYMRLANEALRMRLSLDAERAVLVMDSALPMQRASADFMMAGFYGCHVRSWPHGESRVVCMFAHPKPAQLAAYERAFAGATLEFGAPFYGFSFARATLELPLESADPRLHEMATKYASLVLSTLPAEPGTLSAEVRRLLPSELAQGRATAEAMARRLHMSLRTLGRRLEAEGTSYKQILDEVRHKLALHHLSRSDISIPEVACLLGFADVTTFHRAFKRWTHSTPGAYRAAQRREPLRTLAVDLAGALRKPAS